MKLVNEQILKLYKEGVLIREISAVVGVSERRVSHVANRNGLYRKPFYQRRSDEDILQDYTPVTETGCWLWNGHTNIHGYGSLLYRRKQGNVHRFFYEKLVGKIPDGLHIDHLCKVKLCVNPNHLEAVTQRENNLRSSGMAAINAKKTHCKRGHEFNKENTRLITKKNGAVIRTCKICVRASNNESARRRNRLLKENRNEIRAKCKETKSHHPNAGE